MSKIGDALKKLWSPAEEESVSKSEENTKEALVDDVETQDAAKTVSADEKMVSDVQDAAVKSAVSTVKKSVKVAVEEAVQEAVAEAKGTVIEAFEEIIEDAEIITEVKPVVQKEESRDTKPHAFVVMPFGIKEGFDGTVINFNAIYQYLIKPALEDADFEPFRAD